MRLAGMSYWMTISRSALIAPSTLIWLALTSVDEPRRDCSTAVKGDEGVDTSKEGVDEVCVLAPEVDDDGVDM